MKKAIAGVITLLAAAVMPLTASAHGPSPQKVEKEIVIKAEPAKVWALIKDFGNMQKWHPLVTADKLETKKDESGETATFRTLTIKDGSTIYEQLRSADDSLMKLKYEIVESKLPLTDYNSFIVVKAGPGKGESTVTWVGRFYRLYKLNPPIPAGQDDATAVKAITDIYDAGLPALKRVAEGGKL